MSYNSDQNRMTPKYASKNKVSKIQKIRNIVSFKAGVSLLTLATAMVLGQGRAAAEEPFGTMVGLQAGQIIGPNGQVSQWSGAKTPVTSMEGNRHLMTIEQTEQKALLDWEDFRLQTNEILAFEQESADWLVVNRVHGEHGARIDGEIRARGDVYVFNDNGVLVGEDATINTRNLITGSGFSDVKVEDDKTTLIQSRKKGVLDWQHLTVETEKALEFQQDSADWLVVNRVGDGRGRSLVDGDIHAKGDVYIFNDSGVLVNKDSEQDTRNTISGRGFSDVDVEGDKTTLLQSSEVGILDWQHLQVESGSTLEIKRDETVESELSSEQWVSVHRGNIDEVSNIDGQVQSDGHVYLVGPGGLSVDGNVEAQQVILSSLYIRDEQLTGPQAGLESGDEPTFSNTYNYSFGSKPPLAQDEIEGSDDYQRLGVDEPDIVDENDPERYNVIIGESGRITAGKLGKIMVFGPNVTNLGTVSIQDEGQLLMTAGENIYLEKVDTLNISTDNLTDFIAFSGVYNNLDFDRSSFWFQGGTKFRISVVETAEQADFLSVVLGRKVELGERFNSTRWRNEVGPLLAAYYDSIITERVDEVGYSVRNEGTLNATGGGKVELRGLNIYQNGLIDVKSSALFRGDINLVAETKDYTETGSLLTGTTYYSYPGAGTVVFGADSYTRIIPDLDSTDTLPLPADEASRVDEDHIVGRLNVSGGKIHLQSGSLVYLPSGEMNVSIQATQNEIPGISSSTQQRGDRTTEDGSRFLMEGGAIIDLSGLDITRDMGYHEVSGRLFAAQLANSPIQSDGPFYRKEITIDRRYGTDLADWSSFDNSNIGTIEQFLTDGGRFNFSGTNDFIMKTGSTIDVSGGVTTYKEGFVETTLIRRLDGSVIDIRYADPDEIYMGLANEWIEYDTKWGVQSSYYIPLVSSSLGRFEESYTEGGNGGSISFLTPDILIQGNLLGEAHVGKYQRANLPSGGSVSFGVGATELRTHQGSQYINIIADENILPNSFDLETSLSDFYGDLFGEEYDREDGELSKTPTQNSTVLSEAFFDRSSMGQYTFYTPRAVNPDPDHEGELLDGYQFFIEEGVSVDLKHGASLDAVISGRVHMLGSVITEGGSVSLQGESIILGDDTVIDTSGNWVSDVEYLDYVPLDAAIPRFNAGDISFTLANPPPPNKVPEDQSFIIPETVVLKALGGAWAKRDRELALGTGGDISATVGTIQNVVLAGLLSANSAGFDGNGSFSLNWNSKDIVIGSNTLLTSDGIIPTDEALYIHSDFFERNSFAGITLRGGNVIIDEDAEVNASFNSTLLKRASLNSGDTETFLLPTGTPFDDISHLLYLPPNLRSEDQRSGVEINIVASDAVTVSQGSILSTEVGGSISLRSNNGTGVVAGTLYAPAGQISISAGLNSRSGTGDEELIEAGSELIIEGSARLLTPGISYITSKELNSEGTELVNGEIFDGGEVKLVSETLLIEDGAIIDVSGTSTVFDLPVSDGAGGIARLPVELESDGGQVYIATRNFDIEGATFNATGGGASANGGDFLFSWTEGFVAQDRIAVDDILALDENLFQNGLVRDDNGNEISSLYGTDLSKIQTVNGQPVNFDFADGFTLQDEASFRSFLQQVETSASGAPSLLILGNADPALTKRPKAPDFDAGLLALLGAQLGYELPEYQENLIANLQLDNINAGQFGLIDIFAPLGIAFADTVNLGTHGSLNAINMTSDTFIALNDAEVNLYARTINLSTHEETNSRLRVGSRYGNSVNSEFVRDDYRDALLTFGVDTKNSGASFNAHSEVLTDIKSAYLHGFGKTHLSSGGDIRFSGLRFDPLITYFLLNDETGLLEPARGRRPEGEFFSFGEIELKADQIYAGSGADFDVYSDIGIEILAQDHGSSQNGSPYEAGADLTLRAPRIVQGGVLRSPLGKLTLETFNNGTHGSNEVVLTSGSITSVSADGLVIPYGYTSNSDVWIDPFTGDELEAPPEAKLTFKAGFVDHKAAAILDISGGGDLVAREFIPGTRGTNDWLEGYYTQENGHLTWIEDDSEIYAVLPAFDSEITPIGFDAGNASALGQKVYLSGGDGLAAGEYVLLPKEFAFVPGAYRVTLNHRYGDTYLDTRLGQVAELTDGSTIQAGYFVDTVSGSKDLRSNGFHVMSRESLDFRANYVESRASSLFVSDAYLDRVIRMNRPLGEPPRTPLDGGSIIFNVSDTLNLDGILSAAPVDGNRAGAVDIASNKIAIIGDQSGDSYIDNGYLVLNAHKLNEFGAGSLLIGGTRQAGEGTVDLYSTSQDITIDTQGQNLIGSEMLFISKGDISVEAGSVLQVESQGETSSNAFSNYNIIATNAALIEEASNGDQVTVHENIDSGSFLLVSSNANASAGRDIDAVDLANELRNDPLRLAIVNEERHARGLAPIELNKGIISVGDGASIRSTGAVILDGTIDSIIAPDSLVEAESLTASASVVSIGEVSPELPGLVLNDQALSKLSSSSELTIRSYSSLDFYGNKGLKVENKLTLDGRTFNFVDVGTETYDITASSLTLANTTQGEAFGESGSAKVRLAADNIYLGAGTKQFSGVSDVELLANQRIIGLDEGRLNIPGALTLNSAGVIANSGALLEIDAVGAVTVSSIQNETLPTLQTVGGTLSITGSSLEYSGQTHMTGGQVELVARSGDLILQAGSTLNVSSGTTQFFDKSVSVDAGRIRLQSDQGNIVISENSVLNVSGEEGGGNAGELTIIAGLGEAFIDGRILGSASADAQSGAFNLTTREIANFDAFTQILDAAGFDYSRRFETNEGDILIDSLVEAENIALIANNGSLNVTDTIRANGGRIQLSASENIVLGDAARILANAISENEKGGQVRLETIGENGGVIRVMDGAVIDVSSTTGVGGELHIRAPQIGQGVAIDQMNGTIIGAESAIVEAFRVYNDVTEIDQQVIDRVSTDAVQYFDNIDVSVTEMLGNELDLTVGIELRGQDDVTLIQDWDLSDLRFNGKAGVLSIRSKGDVQFNANLSDGFVNEKIMTGDSWSYNFIGGSNLDSPALNAVLTSGLLNEDKGSVIIGGVEDTIEYFYDPDYGDDTRLYLLNSDGTFARDPNEPNPHEGFFELERDVDTGHYIHPSTGALISVDPDTGDYEDTVFFAKRPLPWVLFSDYNDDMMRDDGEYVGPVRLALQSLPGIPHDADIEDLPDLSRLIQTDQSTGYMVRTGNGNVSVVAARDLILQERQSVIYTAGVLANELDGFYAPTDAQYSDMGGDISLDIAGDIIASEQTPQLPNGYMRRRGSYNPITGGFSSGVDGRILDQYTWFVDYDNFQGGIGALGGGDISIRARGDIHNLGVSIPNTARVVGHTELNDEGEFADPLRVYNTGGGDLSLDAGGSLYGGVFYVADGRANVNIGGQIDAGSQVNNWIGLNVPALGGPVEYIHQSPLAKANVYDLYSMFFTTSGQFDIRAAGDITIEGIMDPHLSRPQTYWGNDFITMTEAASASVLSAGGDVTLTGAGLNMSLALISSSGQDLVSSSQAPIYYYADNSKIFYGVDSLGWNLRPSKMELIAASGDVHVLGAIDLLPAQDGQLTILAAKDVGLSYRQEAYSDFVDDFDVSLEKLTYRSGTRSSGIYMSQTDLSTLNTTTNFQPGPVGFSRTVESVHTVFYEDHLPDLHMGDSDPVRIYALEGDVYGVDSEINVPKSLWVKAGGTVYFPKYQIQHNNKTDLSVIRAGDGIYFANDSQIEILGPGQLEVEAGGDLWIPTKAGIETIFGGVGLITVYDDSPQISSGRVQINTTQLNGTPFDWKPDEKATDIAISVGYNQQPDYEAFEDQYLNPEMTGGIVDYVRDETTGYSEYLFDREYARAGTNDAPENREGLVNFVRRLQGLEPLETREEELTYLDDAWGYWKSVNNDYKLAFYREVLYLELRQSGREANDPESDRFDTTFRGYDAIGTLFPGAEVSSEDGAEFNWNGNVKTDSARFISSGGGDYEFVIPGGTLALANIAAAPYQTGQPTENDVRGDATRSGILTINGGEVSILTHRNVDVNSSRVLTTDGGNILMWSSYGDIGAGLGAQTSISPTFFDRAVDGFARSDRVAVGLPTGAGIGTLSTLDDTPPADVDLIAPAGIIDAGDAGLRVSGNLNVFAVQILGTDNIQVEGTTVGLPTPPAAPPTSLDVDIGDENELLEKAIQGALSAVEEASGNESPSLIQVFVDEEASDLCGPGGKECVDPPQSDEVDTSSDDMSAYIPPEIDFNVTTKPLEAAVLEIGELSGVTIVYDSGLLNGEVSSSVLGKLTAESALIQLLQGQNIDVLQLAPDTILLSPSE